MDFHAPTREAKAKALCDALAASPFWASRNSYRGLRPPATLADLLAAPTISKTELLADQGQNPPAGSIANGPICRLHQTSGTRTTPLAWGDSARDWSRILDIWDDLFEIAEILPADRFLFPFSFGPFLGFWSAFEAATRSGRFCLAAGGLSTRARVRQIERHHISVVLATPSYALRMAEVAREMGFDLKASSVRALILAGEPGANRPALRNRLESAWGARVFDHHGMTETGPVSMECARNPGTLHVAENSYLAQVIDPSCNSNADDGELVLTPLDRLTMPLLRYRTGDLVSIARQPCPCGRKMLAIRGGILGRLDDMLIIRGNNIHPEAIEDWLWSHPEVQEFKVEVQEVAGLARMRITVETGIDSDPDGLVERLRSGFQERFLFQAEFEVSRMPLERSEMKSRRFIRNAPGTG